MGLGFEGLDRVDQRRTAARDHAFLHGSARRRKRVFDAVLLLFEFGLGRGADLNDGNAAAQLGQTLLELFTIEIAVGLFDLTLDHLDAALDRVFFALTVDDGRFFLRDLHGLGLTEQIRGDLVELEAELFADDRRAREGGDVLEAGSAE